MRIGIDCRKILNPESFEQAGIAHYTHYLVQHLLNIDTKNHYTLFVDHRFKPSSLLKRKNSTLHVVPFSQYKRFLPFVYSHMLVAGELEEAKLDVFHAPFPALPLRYKGKSVITVHDMAIFHHPEWFPGVSKQLFATKVVVPRSVKDAAHVIAVSEHTKQDTQHLFHVHPDKITVIHEGVVPELAPSPELLERIFQKFMLQKPYILFVGTLEPRKNISRIIEAFLKLRNNDETFPYTLVLAGGKGWNNKEIFTALEEAGPWVRYFGPISHEDKIALMSHATAFVWPSLWEGFGLPVLEAMALGVPVVTSNTTSIPEVVGDAALCVDPTSVTSLVDALQKVLYDKELRKELSQKGTKRAQDFTWKKAAEETLKVYKAA